MLAAPEAVEACEKDLERLDELIVHWAEPPSLVQSLTRIRSGLDELLEQIRAGSRAAAGKRQSRSDRSLLSRARAPARTGPETPQFSPCEVLALARALEQLFRPVMRLFAEATRAR